MELKQCRPDEGPPCLTKMSIKVSSVSGFVSSCPREHEAAKRLWTASVLDIYPVTP